MVNNDSLIICLNGSHIILEIFGQLYGTEPTGWRKIKLHVDFSFYTVCFIYVRKAGVTSTALVHVGLQLIKQVGSNFARGEIADRCCHLV